MVLSSRAFRLAGSILVALAAFAAFALAMRAGFMFDDLHTVGENENLPRLLEAKTYFTRDYFPVSAEFTYRPLVSLSYALDYRLWGRTPFGFHLSNLLWHSFACVAFFWCCLSLRAPREMSLVAALLYAVHPVRSEAVVCIGFREDLMCAAFYLAALALWPAASRFPGAGAARPGAGKGRGKRPESRRSSKGGARAAGEGPGANAKDWARLAGSLFLWSLALLSKEMALAFPLLALGKELRIRRLDGDRSGFRWRSVLRRQVAAWAIAFAALAMYLLFSAPNAPASVETSAGLFARLGAFAWISLRYVRLLVVPYPLCAEYAVGMAGPVLWLTAGSAIAVLSVVGALCVRIRRRFPEALESFVAFYVMLVPVSGAVAIFNPMAERYLTLPTTAFVWLCAALLGRISAKTARRSAVGFLVGACVVLSWIRVGDWLDTIEFWRGTVERCPASSRAHYNLGHFLAKEGSWEEALGHTKEALRIRPSYPEAENLWGSVCLTLGRIEEAVAHCEAALRLDPQCAEAENNLGVAFFKLGRWQESIDHGRAALRIRPEYAVAEYNLANAFLRAGRFLAAVEHYERALRLKPGDAKTEIGLAEALIAVGREAEAIPHLEAAASLDPGSVQTLNTLAIALFRAGKAKDAIARFEQALRLAPDDPDIHRNLGALFANVGQRDKAILHYERALEIAPDYGEARRALESLRQTSPARDSSAAAE